MLLKKRLARFYANVLQEKGENVKVLAEDMQRYISEKQVEVSDYGNYLNKAYNRLMQEKVEEYENARELYNSLLGVLLNYSQCNFEIRFLKKKKQDVYINQKLCNARKDMINQWINNYYSSINECKQLIDLIKDAMKDTQYNYLILFQNQELLEIIPEDIGKKAGNVKYNDLQKKLWQDSSDDAAAKKAWYAAKTVEEELKIYQEELWQLKIIKKQLYGKVEDYKMGIMVFEQANNVLKQKMDALKGQQKQVNDKKRQLKKDTHKIWGNYFSNSRECMEYENRISIFQRDVDLITAEIKDRETKRDEKNSAIKIVMDFQQDIKSKKNALIEENKSDDVKKLEWIAKIKEIRQHKRDYYSIADRASKRKSALCQEHKSLVQIVNAIKISHKHDPEFGEKIARLNSLSSDIDYAQYEYDVNKRKEKSCKSECQTVQRQIDYYQNNKDRRNEEIRKYEKEQEELNAQYNSLQEDIEELKSEIDILWKKKRSYFAKIKEIRNQKKEYMNKKFDELMDSCQNLLEV